MPKQQCGKYFQEFRVYHPDTRRALSEVTGDRKYLQRKRVELHAINYHQIASGWSMNLPWMYREVGDPHFDPLSRY
jgi:hypothetical protein